MRFCPPLSQIDIYADICRGTEGNDTLGYLQLMPLARVGNAICPFAPRSAEVIVHSLCEFIMPII